LRNFVRVLRPVVLPLFLWSGVAFAQGASVLTGIVSDAATGKPIPDVVVTATSPTLQGEEVTVTDSAGLYRIPQLPPGVYTIRLEKEQFKPYTRGDISLRVDRTIRLNVQMQPEALKAEEVVVVGRAPTIDVGSTTTGINVGQDFMRNVALIRPGGVSGTRSFESLAEAAPQVNSDRYGFSMNGTTSPENQFIIDGLSVNDPAYGLNATPLSVEFVQDVNVITGGYMPEYGRATGGVMNVVTKSGSNEFHGSVFFNITPGALTGPRPTIENRSSTFVQEQAKIWNLGDFGVEVGGPILKDRLWFYAGFAPSFARYYRHGHLRKFAMDPTDDNSDGDDDYRLKDANGNFVSTDLENTETGRFADARSYQFIGKLTFQITPDHSVALSVVGSPFTSGGGQGLGIDPQTGNVDPLFSGTHDSNAHLFRSDAYDVALKYAGAAFDKHLLFDVTLGWHHQYSARLANDGSPIGATEGVASRPMVIYRRTIPHSVTDFEDYGPDVARECAPVDVDNQGTPDTTNPCPVPTYTIGGADFMNNSLLDRWQGRAMVTYLANALGHHVIKAGFDVEVMSYNNQKAYSGGYRLRESLGGGTFLDHRQYGYLQGPDDFVQQVDQVAQSTSTTMGAFVQDSWSIMDVVTLNAGVRWDQQIINGNDGKVGMALNHEWSPRVGLIYDFTQQGRSKLFGNYARYYESVPLDIADRAFPGERQGGFIRYRNPGAAGTTPDNQGCDPLVDLGQTVNECKDPNNYFHLGSAWDPSQNAYVTGGDRVPVDPNIVPQSSDELVFGGEYEVIPDGRAGIQYTKRWMNAVIEDMSRDESNTYFIGNPGMGLAKDFPKATRDYDAVTVYFTKSFSDLWLAQVSYTWSYLRGNYAGLFRPETDQLDPNINSDFDLQSLLPNREGPLPGDRTHVIKIFGAKEFQLGEHVAISLGLTYKGRSGAPINYFGSHELYGADEVFVLPRGSGGRLPWVHTVDSRLAFSYKFTKDYVATISAELFNMFNFSAVTSVDETFTNSDVLPYVPDGSERSPQEQVCIAGSNGSCQRPLVAPDGVTTLTSSELNPNFKQPLSYQAPLSVRFGIRMSF
jgi:Carboxypeptidase regulatory-like domain/TonB dependent receptor/TonB-dependent Receptor Plug Domain